MARAGVGVDPTVVKAMAHPLRFRILVALEDQVASPKQLAGDLGESLGRVGHHVRVLARLGAVELVGTRPRRGATEHFYRAVMRPLVDDAVWSGLPIGARRAIMGSAVGRIVDDTLAAAGTEAFDHPLAHASYTLLELDGAGREEVAAALASLVGDLLDIERRCREREVGLDPTEVVLLHFDRSAPDV